MHAGGGDDSSASSLVRLGEEFDDDAAETSANTGGRGKNMGGSDSQVISCLLPGVRGVRPSDDERVGAGVTYESIVMSPRASTSSRIRQRLSVRAVPSSSPSSWFVMDSERSTVRIEWRVSPAFMRLRTTRRGWSFGPTSKATRHCCCCAAAIAVDAADHDDLLVAAFGLQPGQCWREGRKLIPLFACVDECLGKKMK